MCLAFTGFFFFGFDEFAFALAGPNVASAYLSACKCGSLNSRTIETSCGNLIGDLSFPYSANFGSTNLINFESRCSHLEALKIPCFGSKSSFHFLLVELQENETSFVDSIFASNSEDWLILWVELQKGASCQLVVDTIHWFTLPNKQINKLDQSNKRFVGSFLVVIIGHSASLQKTSSPLSLV